MRVRAEFHRAVTQELSDATGHFFLRGSFVYGDFHLNELTGRSFSDVDLVAPMSTDAECFKLRQVLELRLASALGMSIHVGIHPERNFEELSPEDARFVAVGEYLRRATGGAQDDDYASFMRAKGSLLVMRSYPAERYATVAIRIGTPHAVEAARVKMGLSVHFGVPQTESLLRASPYPEARTLLQFVVDPSPTGRAAYRSQLLERASVSIWLRQYVANQIPE
jgi:hypothetical protein